MPLHTPWAKIRKKVQFREATMFASKPTISMFFDFFPTELSPKGACRVVEKIATNIDFILFRHSGPEN